MLLAVENKIADFQHMRQHTRIGATEHGFDASQQFRCRKRFDDIIIGTHAQATNAFAFFTACGQHDDRQTLCFRPLAQTAAQLDPGNTREHPVQNKKIRHIFTKCDFGFIAAQHRINLIPLGFEIITQEYTQGFFVFNHSNLGCL